MIRKKLGVVHCLMLCLAGVPAFLAAAQSPVAINEFMARNSRTLADEDGAYSDWIELRNVSTADVNLDGWFLTDARANLTKWRLPATTLPAGGYLVVFASGKDRAVAGAELHTNFALDGGGEYLGLVEPDGATIASEFAPAYPEQFSDLSYGNGEQVESTALIESGAPARFQIPTDDSLQGAWTSLSFNDSAWTTGSTGLGFDENSSGSTPGLFAYWPVDEGTGNTTANLVNGGTAGTLQGAQWINNDPVRGTVLSFGGADQYVSAGSIPALARNSGNFSWSFWHYQRSVLNVNSVVLGNREGGTSSPLQFVKFTPTNFEYYRDGQIGMVGYPIPSGQWLHLAVVKAGGTLTYYAAGAVVGASAVGGDMDANPFYWGGDPGAPGEYADGLIDDISLWTAALTAEQIALLASGFSPLALEGLSGFVGTDLADAMLGVNASAYVRVPFQIDDKATFNTLTLRVRYDDGFVAYLNGTEVTRRNAPATLAWNAQAPVERALSEATQFESIDLSGYLDLLVNGGNVLAIQGLNFTSSDPDFLVLPELEGLLVEGEGARYLARPTPGAVNDLGYVDFVDEVGFSHDRGYYDHPFQVALSCGTKDATIRYTTNGTEPSLNNGITYTGLIPVDGNTILRAAAFKPGYGTLNPGARTYLFLDDVLAQDGAGLPQAWGNDWRLDARVVQDPAYAGRIREDLKSLPVVSILLDPEQFWGPQGIYTMATSQGVNYERPASAEMFFPDGSRDGFQINCGLRIAGGASRSSLTPKHGLRLLFKTQYGASKLNYRFFDDTEVDAFDSIAFRPNFNMSWVRTDNSGPLNNGNADGAERTHAIYVRDQFTKDSYTAMGQVGAHERFVHLYVNGVYWGLYNPCERTDASFAATYFGGEKEEYDAIFSDLSSISRPVDGDKNAWNAMLDLANQGLTTPVSYAAIQSYLDVTNLADYMMLNFYCATVDWPWQNWNALRKRESNAQFRMIVWDAEYTLETPPWVPEDRTGVGGAPSEADSPARLYHHLRQNAEWRMLFADRAHRHFFNGGALTREQATARFERLCDWIDRAIVGESARWGDVVRTTQPYTRNAEWLTEKQRLLTEFFPGRTDRVIQQLKQAGLYPQVVAPSFNSHGGVFTSAFSLSMSAPAGSIYYSTNGIDPRLPGGALAPGSLLYSQPVTLTGSRRVMARVLHNTVWSALNEAVFIEATPLPLRITEIMFHPDAPPPGSTNTASDFEFIEIKNVGSTAFTATGVRFTSGLSFTFTNKLFAPGEIVVLTRHRQAFTERYGTGIAVLGEFTGTLDNAGERIRLEGPLGEVIQEFRYSDWYPLTDGVGFSLVPVDPTAETGSMDDATWWRASGQPGGSPGTDDPIPELPTVVVNEILSHTDPPASDSIELRNLETHAVDIGGWFLSDDLQTPHKYRIPQGTLISAHGYRFFSEADFNPTPGLGSSFALSSTGDEVWLFSADAAGQLTGYLHGTPFRAAQNGVSFGRYLNSVGEEFFPAQSQVTLGTANAGPRVGPVVINEILYHPAWGQDEYVELKNIAATNVPLYDPLNPANTWSLSGFGFDLPTGVVLPPQGLLVISRLDPASFRAKYSVPAAVQVFGPTTGILQNDGENLELRRPDAPNPDGVPYLTVDAVRYQDQAPWPIAADGEGAALQRRVSEAYGNDPANWFAAGITPGLNNSTNAPPEIRLLRPLDQQAFEAGGSIELEADALDRDGTVRRVEFFVDGLRLGVVSTPPYILSWAFPDAGVHLLTARATDDRFSTTTSIAVQVAVVAPEQVNLVATGSLWSYLDTGLFPGDGWIEVGFDDSTWSRGPAQLGYGDGDEATVVSYGGVAGNKHITTWFRRAFAVAEVEAWLGLRLGVLRDDGVVVYLNGTEIFRDNLPAGVPIASNTLALQAVEDNSYLQTTVDPGLLLEGINQLAAEIHQVSADSSDISFDLQLDGTRMSAPPTPWLQVQRLGRDLVLYWPNGLTGYVLESTLQLAPANWTPVAGVDGNQVMLDPSGQTRFYRLRGP
ncbi:MAG: lamin tail domain-containing protein [Verrucomicrobia bacterium]|nr:lamin tail domain-containing protein [Verrucomicrobiota bacterium]